MFEAKIGAEGIDELLEKIDVAATIKTLQGELEDASDAKRDRLIRRLKLLKSLHLNGVAPHWMILKALPVIPTSSRTLAPVRERGHWTLVHCASTSERDQSHKRVDHKFLPKPIA